MKTGQNLETLIKKYYDLVGEAGLIKEEILKHVTIWQSQADLGFTVEAMNTYRKQNNCSIKEAHEAVRAFQNQK